MRGESSGATKASSGGEWAVLLVISFVSLAQLESSGKRESQLRK